MNRMIAFVFLGQIAIVSCCLITTLSVIVNIKQPEKQQHCNN